MNDKKHKFYGSTTVGERGQVVIPAEARRDLEIGHGTKLLVFSGPAGEDLVFTRAESMTAFLSQAKGAVSQLEEMIKLEEKEQQ